MNPVPFEKRMIRDGKYCQLNTIHTRLLGSKKNEENEKPNKQSKQKHKLRPLSIKFLYTNKNRIREKPASLIFKAQQSNETSTPLRSDTIFPRKTCVTPLLYSS